MNIRDGVICIYIFIYIYIYIYIAIITLFITRTIVLILLYYYINGLLFQKLFILLICIHIFHMNLSYVNIILIIS